MRGSSSPMPYNSEPFARTLSSPRDSNCPPKSRNVAPELNVCYVSRWSIMRSEEKKSSSSNTVAQSFWNPDGAYMIANRGGGRCGLDQTGTRLVRYL